MCVFFFRICVLPECVFPGIADLRSEFVQGIVSGSECSVGGRITFCRCNFLHCNLLLGGGD